MTYAKSGEEIPKVPQMRHRALTLTHRNRPERVGLHFFAAFMMALRAAPPVALVGDALGALALAALIFQLTIIAGVLQ